MSSKTRAKKMSDTSNEIDEQVKKMVMTFRVSELQMLLGYAGKNKTGRKNELQSRAMDLVRLRNPAVYAKIKELYKTIQLEMMSFGDRTQTAPAGSVDILRSQKVPMGLSGMTGYNSAGNVNSLQSSRYSASQSQVSQNPSSLTSGYLPLSTSSSHSPYPINPDVKLKKLPFYDIRAELLKPSTLAPQGTARYQEASFVFSMTPSQANEIASSRDLRPCKQEYTVQLQMRFCLLETSCEQEDNFPPNISVKINDKMCPLPSPLQTNKAGVEPKRPPRPINITPLCKISPTVSNKIQVYWASEYGRCYVISIYLVKKLSSEDLLKRLKDKGSRMADFTRSLIKQKLNEDADCEIATTSLRCSLLCPLGKMRMLLPCRAITCNHLQCFDASLYIQMNERKPTWTCPVCNVTALYENLVIDGYFQDVLEKNSSSNEVTLQKDGSWSPLLSKKDKEQPQTEKRKLDVTVETLSDDSSDEEDSKMEVEEIDKAKASTNAEVELITLDSDDSDSVPPPPKRTSGYSSNLSSGPCALVSSQNNIHEASHVAGKPSENNTVSSRDTTECTNAPDAWSVREFDPGRRLVVQKSATYSSNGSINSGYSTVPLVSPTALSTATSPQVICLDLDSPAASPTHSPAQPPASSGVSITPVSPNLNSPAAAAPEVQQPVVSLTPIPMNHDIPQYSTGLENSNTPSPRAATITPVLSSPIPHSLPSSSPTAPYPPLDSISQLQYAVNPPAVSPYALNPPSVPSVASLPQYNFPPIFNYQSLDMLHSSQTPATTSFSAVPPQDRF